MKESLYRMILTSLLRGVLFMASGFLISHNVVAPEEMDEWVNRNSQMLAGIVLALVGTAWLSRDKIRQLVRLKLAVDKTPPNITVSSVIKEQKAMPLSQEIKIASQPADAPVVTKEERSRS
jgi:hypothetical protein